MKKGSLVRQKLFTQKRNNNNAVYRYGIFLSKQDATALCEVYWHPCEQFLVGASYTDWVHCTKLEEVSAAASTSVGGSGDAKG
jgi:hypothetical protein